MRDDASTQPGYDDAVVAALLDRLMSLLRARRRPWRVGLSGLQGSGKSTLARQIANAARERDVSTCVLSLDDFYLGRRARSALALDIDPLLATRGVPGTHDVALLDATLNDLRRATAQTPAHIPRFDKGLDTRLPPSRWTRVVAPPSLILLEGWCVGVHAQSAAALARACNALERDEDASARWRGWVNARLADDYADLWLRLDATILLRAPDFGVVSRWRDEQERALRLRGAPRALSRRQLQRFLMHYERISRHALRTLPASADIVVALDQTRRVVSIRAGGRSQAFGSTTTAVP